MDNFDGIVRLVELFVADYESHGGLDELLECIHDDGDSVWEELYEFHMGVDEDLGINGEDDIDAAMDVLYQHLKND